MTALADRIAAKVIGELCPIAGFDFCWTWTGALNSRGYGCISIEGKSQLAHRASYELHVGAIKAGLQIDHLCGNKRCVNPQHLEAVTGRINCSRTDRATKTHCVNGHLFTEQNTIWRKRGKGGDLRHRACRQCQNEKVRDYYYRQKAAS